MKTNNFSKITWIQIVSFLMVTLSCFNNADAQSIGQFRSRQTGNWNNPTTWEQGNGGGWSAQTGSGNLAVTPTINGTNKGVQSSNSNTHLITLPTGIVNGEMLVVVFSTDADPGVSISSGSGWVELDEQNEGNDVAGAIYWKIADGSDALTLATGSDQQSSHISYRISGASSIFVNNQNGNNANSNPTSLTPALGSREYLWIATRSGDGTTVATAAPTNFSNLQTQAGGGDGASTNSAVRTFTGSSLDPGSFTSATEQWVSFTIAVAGPDLNMSAIPSSISVKGTNKGVQSSNSNTHLINLPTGIVNGEMLVVIFSTDADPGVSISSGSGWVELDEQNEGNDVAGAIYWKIANGSDALTLATAGGGQQSSHISYRISGASSIFVNNANGNGTNSNPTTLTPDLGSREYLWIATRSGDASTVATAAPTDFSDLQTQAGGADGASTNSAVRTFTGSSLNPGSFTSANEQWVSFTIAISGHSDATVQNSHVVTVTEDISSPNLFVTGQVTVNDAKSLSVVSGKTVDVSGTLKFLAESFVSGAGNLKINTDATLEIGSINGISSGTSSGNIRVSGTRTYGTLGSGALSYVFNANSNQSIGNGMPLNAKNVTLSGGNVKTFINANLDITLNLTIVSSNTMIIPNGSKYSAGNLYFGSDIQAISYWGGTNASVPFTGSASPFSYYLAPSNYKAFKSANFGTTTTGILLAAAAALPVTLTSFTAKPTSTNTVALNWATSSEIVNKGFRIERQAGGVNGKFESLGFVASKAIGGNSQTALYYNFIDASPRSGATSYYRLAQEDLDGKTTFSEVRVVKFSGETVYMVYPNPSNGAVNISRTATGKKMNVQVIDMAGRMLQQFTNITDSNFKLNISKSGMYNIKMTYPETGEQSVQRIVIER